ncbi:hypothetical protein PUG46_05430 [Erwiniaceae bacterium L1_55_4]|uniref:hypothetical protein n=1 Tax=Candidatus Pantoea communis TaxID=2608354 RepID=UPI0014238B8C|nr:hypothetical protein [Pantoea communis]MDF7628709.1 hypothetical protein [Erwiniaceae bacterium L1_55_4]
MLKRSTSSLENLAFTLPLMLLRNSSDPEAASHFVYLNRQNPLNRKNSFLLSAFFVTR